MDSLQKLRVFLENGFSSALLFAYIWHLWKIFELWEGYNDSFTFHLAIVRLYSASYFVLQPSGGYVQISLHRIFTSLLQLYVGFMVPPSERIELIFVVLLPVPLANAAAHFSGQPGQIQLYAPRPFVALQIVLMVFFRQLPARGQNFRFMFQKVLFLHNLQVLNIVSLFPCGRQA